MVRPAVEESSRGTGLPSAVEGMSEMLEVFGCATGGKVRRGSECRRDFDVRVVEAGSRGACEPLLWQKAA